ncbi:hypothetical protein [Aliarcobacter lanthieri]|uniref:hypothetical protein n=1 Tax=Aliarcobacter lanthieri TaxID=1355374 RepID=UPI00047EB3E2|nr:hypothetical protein [Aliarcobacter lanthieri]QKF59261.1 hypothetical protein ALANTH_1152 [Aliarcobacter lanthieri]
MKKIPISEYYENEAKEYDDFLIDNEALTCIRRVFTIEFEAWSGKAICVIGDDIALKFWRMNGFQTGMLVYEEFLDIATFCALFNCNVNDLDYSNIRGYHDKSIEGIYRAFNNDLSLDKYENLAKNFGYKTIGE